MEETSLEDFRDVGDGGGPPGDESGGDEDADAGEDGGRGRAASADPDPTGDETSGSATDGAEGDADPPTYAWSPDGVACGTCGAVVERRWGADGRLVCGDCKEW